MNTYPEGDIESLINQKEQELREFQHLKIRGLENKVTEKEKQYELLELQYKELQRDFGHNVDVIRERDEDIQELVTHITQLKALIESKQKEFDTVRTGTQEEVKAASYELSQLRDKQRSLYEKIDDLKHENKKLKSLQSDEVQRNREEYEKKIKILQAVIREHEETIKLSTDDFNQRLKNLSGDSTKANENFTKIIENVKREKQQLLEEFNKKLDILQTDNQKLRDEFNKSTHDFMAKDQEHHQKFVELKSKLQEAQAHRELAERELTELKVKSGTWDTNLRDKTDFYQREIESLTGKLISTKAKYKNKLNFISGLNEKKIEDLIRDNSERSRRFEEEIKRLVMDNEKLMMSEKMLKERLQEAEHRFNKELRFYEDRIGQLSRNNEQDQKKLANDKELKDYQINQLTEQIRELEKRIAESQKSNNELESKIRELEKENNIMIEEIASQRKEQPHQQNIGRKNLPGLSLHRIGASPGKGKESQFIKNAQGHGKIEKEEMMDDINEILTEKSFDQALEDPSSWDQGSVSPLMVSSPLMGSQYPRLQQGTKMLRSNQSVAVKLIHDQLEQAKRDVEYYKDLIEKMRQDMENVRYRMETNNQELNVTKKENEGLKERLTILQLESLNLKEKILDVTNHKNEAELMVRTLKEKKERLNEEIDKLSKELEQVRALNIKTEEDNNAIKQKSAAARNEVEKLKAERDQLIEISNNLRSRMNKLEELGRVQDNAESRVFHDDHDLRISHLTQELHDVKDKLKTVQGGRAAIARKKSPEPIHSATKRKENYIPEREAYEKGRNNFKESITKIKSSLYLESSAKPLLDRNLEEGEQVPQYRPNSQKATRSQKEIEERLAANRLRKLSPQKARNYNIRDDNAA